MNFGTRVFEGQPTKENLLRMMDYVNFVHIHEIFRFSFKDLCENLESDGEERPPTVCMIALNGPN